jgi:Tol biopolymer transport system component
VFQAALQRTPEERAAFVQETCGDDVALRTEVESLLSSLEQAGSVGERPAIQSLAAANGLATSRRLDIGEARMKAGESLGPYKILELVGAGGMGQVYRARDGKLNRDVALKILPDTFAANPDRLARFRREAQVLASLNHPNIGHIYGLEDAGVPQALVLELVEGPTLADVIARSRATAALNIPDALGIALQVAEALEAAHEQGVVHRDLKPDNIKVRPDGVVKVLDFGLARAFDPAPASAAEAIESPTMTSPGHMTGSGVILGTAPYMSPEQTRGKVVDKRTDIWAFGCVLFEMLTGRRPFDGATSSDTIAGILTREPDWTTLPPATPAKVRGLLQRCLEKDPKRRLRDIGEARIEIEQIGESGKAGSTRRPRPLGRWAVVAAALVVLLAGVYAILILWRSSQIGPLQYTQLTDFSDTATAPSLSPDGRMVAFIRGGPYFQNPRQVGQIYVKLLPNGEAVRLTNDPRPKFAPVFTPDGSRVAYSLVDGDDGSWDTWTVPVLGGEAKRILPNASALTWLSDARVLFSEIKSGSGMHMGIVTATEFRADSRVIYFPEHERAMAHYSYASPDRQWILIVEMGSGGGFTQRCRLVPFDASSGGRLVGPEGPCRSAAWSPDGRWMYFGADIDGRSHLWRQSFPNGPPEQMTFDPTEEEGIAVAPDGKSLVTSVGEQRNAIWIHDDAGERPVTSEGSARLPLLSRDGQHLFYLQGAELVQLDLASGKTSSAMPGMSVGFGYDVSADKTEVAFVRSPGREGGIWLASLDRRFPPREIVRGGDQVSFGANGTLVYRHMDKNANYLYRVNRDGSGREPVLSTPILNKFAVSPDGEWAIVNRATTEEGAAQERGGGTHIETAAIPLRGGAARRICAYNCLPAVQWSPDGKFLYIEAGQRGTAVMPVPAGQSLPDLPPSGLSTPSDALKLPGARLIAQRAVIASPNLSKYLFVKTELRRNLFRIRLR